MYIFQIINAYQRHANVAKELENLFFKTCFLKIQMCSSLDGNKCLLLNSESYHDKGVETLRTATF